MSSSSTEPRSRRRRNLAIGSIAVVPLVAIAGWQLFPTNETTSVSVDQSIEKFSESSKPLDTGGVPLPPSGVYRYRTRGQDTADAVLDATNELDGTSTVTVARSDCGIDERWDALEQRWDEYNYCVDGRRWRLVSATQMHSFFGRDERRNFNCRGPWVPRPPVARAGSGWTARCHAEGRQMKIDGSVLRSNPVTVGGKPIEAVQVRLAGTLSGETTGKITIDSWYSRKDGLLLRRRGSSDVTVHSTPVGKASNRERYTIELISTNPSR